MCNNIIYANPFKSSFRWVSHDLDDRDYKDIVMVYCCECNQISEAMELESGRHRYCCPVCKKRIIRFFKKGTYITKLYSKVFDYEDKIVFSCAFYHHLLKYSFNNKKMRKMSLLYRYNVTHNKITKQTYLVRKASNPKNNKIANITFGSLPTKWSLIWPHLQFIEQDLAWKEFREKLVPSWFDFDRVSGISQFPLYLRYPHLSLLPFGLTLNGKFRQELKKAKRKREQLSDVPIKQIEVLEWFAGKRVTKKERKILIDNPNLIFVYRLAFTLFENVDIRHYFIEELEKRAYLIDSGDVLYFSEYILEDLFKKKFAINHLKIKKHYTNEKKFAKDLLQLMQYGPDDPYDIINHYSYVRDIVKMQKELVDEIPGYQLPPFETIKSHHDILAKDYEKIQNKCIEIDYTEDEIEKLESDMSTHRFKLAESNHELIDVGSKLGICVGSYASYTIKKEIYIVLVEDKETNAITHCLEVSNGEKLKLVQAKGKYNSRPSESISDMIVQYSKERGIGIDTYDIILDGIAS
ncbi:PcfJ domain-containing protein [Bacillus toyonensis]|uniref:PcfJ domain-containing protein n=1 Tax=Bacillus toyonensis TaxID=155322 RepID=UPI001C0ADE41|nr:PcfJ domain-containing protein [Bacillus toyonensis]MBU4643033.1 PcfJ domain-containing protein [Bacillus toyonensis]